MKKGNHRSFKLISTIFVIGLFTMFMLGCSGGSSGSSGSSGDDNGSGSSPQTYMASGTYTYDANTGNLTANFTSTEFTACGPELGPENIDVSSISVNTMVWDEGSDDELTWQRDGGTAGDITGTWDFENEDGNTYEININGDGTIVVIGEIVVCREDDGEDGDNSDPGTGGDTSTWSLTLANDLDSVQTNTTCDLDAIDMDTIDLVVKGSSFTFTTEDGNVFFGGIVGNLYSYTGNWMEDGVSYFATGSLTLDPGANTLSGTGVVTATEGTDFCIWSQDISGARQNS